MAPARSRPGASRRKPSRACCRDRRSCRGKAVSATRSAVAGSSSSRSPSRACAAVAFPPDDALIYASTFAETRSLEDYLTSFPTASPLLFQTSIHPGAVQQVLIGRQQPVGRFWPLTGRRRLVEHALLTALLEPVPR